MRATPVLLAIVAALAAGCASGTGDTGPDLGVLADQAERVGALVEEDRPCEAAEAARTLSTLAERDDLELEVRQAVVSFASSAEASITCDPAATPTETSPTTTADHAPADDGDDGEGQGDGNDDEDDKGEGNDGDGKPGRGKGRDNGNGNGNGDD